MKGGLLASDNHCQGQSQTFQLFQDMKAFYPLRPFPITIIAFRHNICQKNYAIAVLEARMLRKKRVNRDVSQFATKER